MKLFAAMAAVCLCASVEAQVQLGKGVQIGGSVSGGVVSSFNTRTGAVVPANGDYTLSNIGAGASPTGLFDFSAATHIKLPIHAGYTAAVSGEIGYDSTNGNAHFNISNTDLILLGVPSASLPTSGQCAQFQEIGAWWQLIGVSCGSGILTGQTAGYAVEAATPTTATTNFPLDDAVTLAGYITAHKKFQVVSGGSDPSEFSLVQNGNVPTVVASSFSLAAPAAVTTANTVAGFTAPCSGVWTLANSSGVMSSTCTAPGGLPTAASPGQIISSTAAGSAYAVQGQIFYSQSGDTIASIETECSSLCTYVVTVPQTLTLAANHTLSANVQLSFKAGGLWTVNGAFTLTLSGKVEGTLNPHFAGSSVINGLSGAVPVEWFGAVGFTSRAGAGGGPDYTTQIQNTLNSLTGGGWAQLQMLSYNASSGLAITTSSVGIHGIGGRDNFGPPVSSIVSNSATINILSVHGANSSSDILWNTFEKFSLERLVQPSGTTPGQATGFFLQYTGGTIIDTVASDDNLDGFYFNGTPGDSSGRFTNLACANGFQGVNSYSGVTITCYEIDSSNGVPMNSATFVNDGISVAGTAITGATTRAYWVHGTNINDLDIYSGSGSQVNYGLRVDYTGTGGAGTASDVHIVNPTFDGCRTTCVLINGLPNTGGSSLRVDGGWTETNVASAKIVDIESSYGVTITNNMIIAAGASGGAIGIYANGSGSLTLSLNKMQLFATGIGIQLNNTTSSVVTGNTNLGSAGFVYADGISLTGGSVGNTISGNNTSGNATIAYAFDSTSNINDFGTTNTCAGSSIGTCVSGTPAGLGVLVSGAGGVNSNCLSVNGPGASPNTTYVCSIASVQSVFGINGYYNGTSFIYDKSGGALLERFLGGAAPTYQISICPSGSAGATMTGEETTCVTEWMLQNKVWFNPQATSPTFPTNASLVLNPSANWWVDTSGNHHATSVIPTTLYSAAGTALPTCAIGIKGELAVVSDATTPTYMGAYTSGGAITASVICSFNGTTFSWLTH